MTSEITRSNLPFPDELKRDMVPFLSLNSSYYAGVPSRDHKEIITDKKIQDNFNAWIKKYPDLAQRSPKIQNIHNEMQKSGAQMEKINKSWFFKKIWQGEDAFCKGVEIAGGDYLSRLDLKDIRKETPLILAYIDTGTIRASDLGKYFINKRYHGTTFTQEDLGQVLPLLSKIPKEQLKEILSQGVTDEEEQQLHIQKALKYFNSLDKQLVGEHVKTIEDVLKELDLPQIEEKRPLADLAHSEAEVTLTKQQIFDKNTLALLSRQNENGNTPMHELGRSFEVETAFFSRISKKELIQLLCMTNNQGKTPLDNPVTFNQIMNARPSNEHLELMKIRNADGSTPLFNPRVFKEALPFIGKLLNFQIKFLFLIRNAEGLTAFHNPSFLEKVIPLLIEKFNGSVSKDDHWISDPEVFKSWAITYNSEGKTPMHDKLSGPHICNFLQMVMKKDMDLLRSIFLIPTNDESNPRDGTIPLGIPEIFNAAGTYFDTISPVMILELINTPFNTSKGEESTPLKEFLLSRSEKIGVGHLIQSDRDLDQIARVINQELAKYSLEGKPFLNFIDDVLLAFGRSKKRP